MHIVHAHTNFIIANTPRSISGIQGTISKMQYAIGMHKNSKSHLQQQQKRVRERQRTTCPMSHLVFNSSWQSHMQVIFEIHKSIEHTSVWKTQGKKNECKGVCVCVWVQYDWLQICSYFFLCECMPARHNFKLLHFVLRVLCAVLQLWLFYLIVDIFFIILWHQMTA